MFSVLPENFRSAFQALIAQSAEHTLGKGEVMGSNLIEGSVAENKIYVY